MSSLATRLQENELVDEAEGLVVNSLEHQLENQNGRSHSNGQTGDNESVIVIDYNSSDDSEDSDFEDDDLDGNNENGTGNNNNNFNESHHGILRSEWYRYPDQKRPKPLLLLLLVVAFLFGNATSITVSVEIVKSVFCRPLYPDEDYYISNPVCANPEVANHFLRFMTITSILGSFGSILFTPKCSALSDRIGRKPIIIVAGWLLGLEVVAYLSIFLFPQYLGVKFIYLTSISSFSGSVPTLNAAIQSYISDAVKPRLRSSWIGYCSAAMSIIMTVGPLCSSLITKAGGGSLLPILLISSLTPFLAALLTMWLLPESRSVKARRMSQLSFESSRTNQSLAAMSSQQSFFDLSSWKYRLKLLMGPFKPLQKLKFENVVSLRDRRNAWMLTGFLLFLSEIGVGVGSLYVIYPQLKFGWTSVETGYFVSVVSAARTFTLLLILPNAIKILGKLWHVSTKRLDMVDSTIIRTSLVSAMLSQLLIISAKTGPLFAAGVGSLTLSNSLLPVLTSALIKFANRDEVGEVMGAISLIQSLGALVGPVVFMKIFSATSETRPNYAFKVVCSLYFVLFVLSAFFLPIRREDEDRFAVFKPTPRVSPGEPANDLEQESVQEDEEGPSVPSERTSLLASAK